MTERKINLKKIKRASKLDLLNYHSHHHVYYFFFIPFHNYQFQIKTKQYWFL